MKYVADFHRAFHKLGKYLGRLKNMYITTHVVGIRDMS